MSQRAENERTVVFGHVDESKVSKTLADQGSEAFRADDIAAGVPKFTKVDEYTTFAAEWVLQNGNIIVHFFLPSDFERGAQSKRVYWTMLFPIALDYVAQEVFAATAPRLQAKYTEELNSWWFRANKYDHIIDLKAFLRKFFDSLDAELEKALSAENSRIV